MEPAESGVQLDVCLKLTQRRQQDKEQAVNVQDGSRAANAAGALRAGVHVHDHPQMSLSS